jgi:5'-deoxynucleotidase YfbR-like HD superfamily hydrolase
MLSGRRLDLLDPSPLDVELEDIAHGLARVARWNGQTFGNHAFSVAQHSLLVEQVAAELLKTPTREDRLYALLHDAPEYVIGDMISPFKAVMGGAYKDVELRLEQAVHVRMGLSADIPGALKKTIKKADGVVAYYEATKLAGFSETEARQFFAIPKGINPDTLNLEPMPTVAAQNAFIDRVRAIEQSS